VLATDKIADVATGRWQTNNS